MYIVQAWNINGFRSFANPCNTEFKLNVINKLYADVWILTETHSKSDEVIDVPSFTVFQYNRQSSSKCKKGSGGVAIAIHNSLWGTHSLIGIHKGIDGQIGVKLKNNLNNLTVGFIGLYLSPDGYQYGRDPESFFNEASVIWQDFDECDLVIGAGDVNSRIRNDLEQAGAELC